MPTLKMTHLEKPARLPGSPYTVREAAQYLRVSPRTIFNLLKRGLLRSTKALRHRIIPAEDVESFVMRTL